MHKRKSESPQTSDILLFCAVVHLGGGGVPEVIEPLIARCNVMVSPDLRHDLVPQPVELLLLAWLPRQVLDVANVLVQGLYELAEGRPRVAAANLKAKGAGGKGGGEGGRQEVFERRLQLPTLLNGGRG